MPKCSIYGILRLQSSSQHKRSSNFQTLFVPAVMAPSFESTQEAVLGIGSWAGERLRHPVPFLDFNAMAVPEVPRQNASSHDSTLMPNPPRSDQVPSRRYTNSDCCPPAPVEGTRREAGSTKTTRRTSTKAQGAQHNRKQLKLRPLLRKELGATHPLAWQLQHSEQHPYQQDEPQKQNNPKKMGAPTKFVSNSWHLPRKCPSEHDSNSSKCSAITTRTFWV
ncbi:hypothetical protein QBC46DRAFT_32703 [Diplogelasinospora grovesii]|uniref:Uncharacterized protein n=1 Tax=Diplogelasinospora grovesii TaxID=303347 RepID=A0AAN6N148_9PEZI|nr:hypothetical protein QBC46DRAFT_32703 [Diplogelasinospora grovesii]